MKKIFSIALILLLVGAATVSAQILKPVKWAYAAKKTGRNEAVVYLKATIDEGWHLYSQHIEDGGPVKTTFAFFPSKIYALQGGTIEPKPVIKYEEIFGMNVSYFEKSVIFQQKVKLSGSGAVAVKGKIEYMVCNDQQCLPPEEVEFTVSIQ